MLLLGHCEFRQELFEAFGAGWSGRAPGTVTPFRTFS